MINNLTVLKAIEGLKKNDFSSVELTSASLERIKKTNDKINSFVTVSETALEEAKEKDEDRKKGKNLPLLGIPIAVKDNFSTKNLRTTASSKVLEDYIPPYDATVIKKLRDAGAIIIGKTNLDAWAHGSSTETSDFGPTKNPWDINFLPGGSSGGSAASVASDQVVASIGTETAGSIRQPASWCGVVGLKPTYGRVSRYGVIAMGSSLDSPGPITKTVRDASILLDVISGKDELDATTSLLKIGDYHSQNFDIKKIKIGISPQYFIDGIDKEVEDLVKEAIKKLVYFGAKDVEINLFDPKYAIDVYTIIQRFEVSSNLAWYDGIRFGFGRERFGEEAKRRIMFGTYALSSGYYDQYYNKAQKVRTVIIDDFRKAFEKIDVLIAPTSPTLPLPLGSTKEASMFGEIADVLVEPSSIAGLSGINIPIGFSKSGLPIGMQIIGPQFKEDLVLSVANFYETNTEDEEWRKKKTNL